MTWTANITKTAFDNGALRVDVIYTDGTRTHSETYRTNVPYAAWISDNVRERIKSLDMVDNATSYFPVGTVTPSVEPTPTPDDEKLFFNRLDILIQLKTLVDMGILSPTEPKLVALKNWISARVGTYFDKMTG